MRGVKWKFRANKRTCVCFIKMKYLPSHDKSAYARGCITKVNRLHLIQANKESLILLWLSYMVTHFGAINWRRLFWKLQHYYVLESFLRQRSLGDKQEQEQKHIRLIIMVEAARISQESSPWIFNWLRDAPTPPRTPKFPRSSSSRLLLLLMLIKFAPPQNDTSTETLENRIGTFEIKLNKFAPKRGHQTQKISFLGGHLKILIKSQLNKKNNM